MSFTLRLGIFTINKNPVMISRDLFLQANGLTTLTKNALKKKKEQFSNYQNWHYKKSYYAGELVLEAILDRPAAFHSFHSAVATLLENWMGVLKKSNCNLLMRLQASKLPR